MLLRCNLFTLPSFFLLFPFSLVVSQFVVCLFAQFVKVVLARKLSCVFSGPPTQLCIYLNFVICIE